MKKIITLAVASAFSCLPFISSADTNDATCPYSVKQGFGAYFPEQATSMSGEKCIPFVGCMATGQPTAMQIGPYDHVLLEIILKTPGLHNHRIIDEALNNTSSLGGVRIGGGKNLLLCTYTTSYKPLFASERKTGQLIVAYYNDAQHSNSEVQSILQAQPISLPQDK